MRLAEYLRVRVFASSNTLQCTMLRSMLLSKQHAQLLLRLNFVNKRSSNPDAKRFYPLQSIFQKCPTKWLGTFVCLLFVQYRPIICDDLSNVFVSSINCQLRVLDGFITGSSYDIAIISITDSGTSQAHQQHISVIIVLRLDCQLSISFPVAHQCWVSEMLFMLSLYRIRILRIFRKLRKLRNSKFSKSSNIHINCF